MKRTLTILAAIILAASMATASADTHLWITTEGAGLSVSSHDRPGTPPPPPPPHCRHHPHTVRHCKECEKLAKKHRKEMLKLQKQQHKEMKKARKEHHKHNHGHNHHH